MRVVREYEITLPEEAIREHFGEIPFELLDTCTRYVDVGEIGDTIYYVKYLSSETSYTGETTCWGQFNDLCGEEGKDYEVLFKIEEWDADEIDSSVVERVIDAQSDQLC